MQGVARAGEMSGREGRGCADSHSRRGRRRAVDSVQAIAWSAAVGVKGGGFGWGRPRELTATNKNTNDVPVCRYHRWYPSISH
jgi:hypothetical protein